MLIDLLLKCPSNTTVHSESQVSSASTEREASAFCPIVPSVWHKRKFFRLSQAIDRLQLRSANVWQLEHGEHYHYLSCSDINSHLNSSSASKRDIIMLCQYPIFVGRCVREMQRLFDQISC